MSPDRDEFYRQQMRDQLGDGMFEHCRQVAATAPPPTPDQIAVIGRIFGPALRRRAQREAIQRPSLAA